MIAKRPSNSGPRALMLCRSGLVSLLLIAAAGFGGPAPVSGQATAGSDSKYTRSPKNTYFIDCGPMPPYASHSAHSPVLVSPDRKRSAFAQASARWADGTCVNISKIYVAERGRGYQVVFLQVPTVTLLGNGVRLIDWSKDGAR